MLVTQTIVKPSKISGMGLFALEDISKGAIVWEYDPETAFSIREKQLMILEESEHHTEFVRFIVTYGFYVKALDSILLDLDNGRFINHSIQPNLGLANVSSEEVWKYSVALRDISKGEELTEDYRNFEVSSWSHQFIEKYRVFDVFSKVEFPSF